MQQQEQPKVLSPRWTREILERCNAREILVIVAAYGAAQVARRMGYSDIEKIIQERQ
jgi:hypothetical protein